MLDLSNLDKKIRNNDDTWSTTRVFSPKPYAYKHYQPANKEWKTSVYNYNENLSKNLPITDTVVSKIISNYFTIIKLKKKGPSKLIERRLRRLSLNRILVSSAEMKHTNNKVIITVYLYNKNKKVFLHKTKKLYNTLNLSRKLKKIRTLNSTPKSLINKAKALQVKRTINQRKVKLSLPSLHNKRVQSLKEQGTKQVIVKNRKKKIAEKKKMPLNLSSLSSISTSFLSKIEKQKPSKQKTNKGLIDLKNKDYKYISLDNMSGNIIEIFNKKNENTLRVPLSKFNVDKKVSSSLIKEKYKPEILNPQSNVKNQFEGEGDLDILFKPSVDTSRARIIERNLKLNKKKNQANATKKKNVGSEKKKFFFKSIFNDNSLGSDHEHEHSPLLLKNINNKYNFNAVGGKKKNNAKLTKNSTRNRTMLFRRKKIYNYTMFVKLTINRLKNLYLKLGNKTVLKTKYTTLITKYYSIFYKEKFNSVSMVKPQKELAWNQPAYMSAALDTQISNNYSAKEYKFNVVKPNITLSVKRLPLKTPFYMLNDIYYASSISNKIKARKLNENLELARALFKTKTTKKALKNSSNFSGLKNKTKDICNLSVCKNIKLYGNVIKSLRNYFLLCNINEAYFDEVQGNKISSNLYNIENNPMSLHKLKSDNKLKLSKNQAKKLGLTRHSSKKLHSYKVGQKNKIKYLFKLWKFLAIKVRKHKKFLLRILKWNNGEFSNFENNYYKNFIKQSYRKELFYLYYIKMLSFNNDIFKNWFLMGLKNKISKIYNKNIEFNFVNLKYMYLNSDILNYAIAVKLRNRRNRLLFVLKKALDMIKIPKMYINQILVNDSKLKSYNEKNEYKQKDVISSIKYKSIIGVRFEAAGRLSKRLTASRSVFKIRYKGGLRDVDTYIKYMPTNKLRNHKNPNLQYTKVNSKTRNGSFGLKGWLSAY